MKNLIPLILLCALPNLLSAQGYVLNGNAQALEDDCYQLTPALNTQNGTVWYDEQLDLGQAFEIEFLMNLGSIDAQGADGIVFCMQTVGVNAIGVTGGGIGFQGFDPSFGIEFDTWQNGNFSDPTEDHIAFQLNGNVDHSLSESIAGPVQMSDSAINTEDGLDHRVKVIWDADAKNISVYFDCVLRLEHQIDIAAEVFAGEEEVWWGFTSGTGAANNLHVVCLQENILSINPQLASCNGEPVQLEAVGSLEGDYSWTPEAGLSDSNIANPVANPAETTTYVVSFTDFCGFTKTDSTTVIVESLEVDLGPDQSACVGESILLEALSEQAVSYLWSDDSDSSSITVTESGTYAVTVTGNNCTASAEVFVDFSGVLQVELGEDISACEGEQVLLQSNVSDAIYLWSDNSEEESLLVTESGTYSLQVDQDACIGEDEIVVTFDPAPNPDLGADIIACEGDEVVLQSDIDEATYLWSDDSEGESLTVTESGTYSLQVEKDGCTGTGQVEVSFTPLPAPELGDDISACAGSLVELSTQYTEGIEWQDGSSNATQTVSTSGTYSISITEGECTGSDEIAVDFEALPDPGLTRYLYICEQAFEPYLLHVDAVEGVAYEWQDGSTESSYLATDQGEYVLTSSLFDCTRSDTLEVIFWQCAVLPIELQSFSGRIADQENLLTWSAYVYEEEVQFELQASADGQQFETIFRQLAYPSSVLQAFEFAHQELYPRSYYRLAYRSAAGEMQYSSVIVLERESAFSFSIGLNPVQDLLQWQVEGEARNISIQIFDASGIELYASNSLSLASGELNVAELSAGLYLLALSNKQSKVVQRFVKL